MIFLRQTKTEEICCQYTCLERNVFIFLFVCNFHFQTLNILQRAQKKHNSLSYLPRYFLLCYCSDDNGVIIVQAYKNGNVCHWESGLRHILTSMRTWTFFELCQTQGCHLPYWEQHNQLQPYGLKVPPCNYVIKEMFLKSYLGGFPGGAVVENLPANAGVHGFESWSGKIPHAAEQLSLWATTTEARAHRACAPQQEKPPQWEARAPQRRVAPTRCN